MEKYFFKHSNSNPVNYLGLLRDVGDQVHHAVTVSHFVVVPRELDTLAGKIRQSIPRDEFDKVGVEGDAGARVEDRGMVVRKEVGGYDLQFENPSIK